MLGRILTMEIDRPLGTFHPNHPNIYYPINYGYIKDIIGGDGEEQDVYLLGVSKPVKKFTGRIIAIIHRLNDNEDKWVMAPIGMRFNEKEIRAQTNFMEQHFKSTIKCLY